MFFLPIRTIFELNCRIKETNVLTIFHKALGKNVSYRLFTCFHYIHIENTAPTPGGHVFQMFTTIFKPTRYPHNQYINKTKVLTKFHDDWANIVTSRVFTRNTASPPGGHVFQRTRTIFEHNQHTIKTNILTNFELSRGIIGTNVLTKFNEDRTRNVPLEFSQGNMLMTDARRTKGLKTNFQTKFHEDWTINVTPRVFTRFNYSHIRKTALPTGGHVFLPIRTIFKLNRRIQKTNVLTKFHEDWTKNVTSRAITCFHYIHIEKTAPPPWRP
ncbi:hypothetical protein DPMN_105468 [Dreissena polymorpha]|uniref:Uncharacterized protein n=1 Tax=Dreissena polymorpha TaxID=45954 RepID=A0A9D4K0Z0_DREPO|nr:hypothetical protein DPMN_105468 [Dreissena polymorpha]